MTLNNAIEKLKSYEATSFALRHAMGVMYYDGVTVAPHLSEGVRGYSLGELSRLDYQNTTAPETVEMLEALIAGKDSLDEITRRKAEVLYRDYERTKRVPEDEFVAYQSLLCESETEWHRAKRDDDFERFEPYLDRVFASAKKIYQYMEPDRDPYDTALDTYEKGLTRETCDKFFAALREKLVPLIEKVVKNGDKVDATPLVSDYPVSGQKALTKFVMETMGVDLYHCVVGETEHPFTTDFSKDDVRITTHYYKDNVLSGMYSVIHESGHALYELHTADELKYSCLGTGVSMAIHESQSRFYENIIGRSRQFCDYIYDWLRAIFPPRFDNISKAAFYKMVNKSEPSLIRTEADELTYCLHIMIRYELEKMMFDGKITAKELPGEWNRLYKEYLGVDVPDFRQGILQDSHWSAGNIGYFPSYAIGSAYGAQYLKEMSKEFDALGDARNGNFGNINKWMEEKIWRHGSMMDPTELFESVCGKFEPQVFVDYLTEKFTDIYEL